MLWKVFRQPAKGAGAAEGVTPGVALALCPRGKLSGFRDRGGTWMVCRFCAE